MDKVTQITDKVHEVGAEFDTKDYFYLRDEKNTRLLFEEAQQESRSGHDEHKELI